MRRSSFDVPPVETQRLVVPVEEIHVASLVVHARPERVEELEQAIAAFTGVEVAAADRSGKLVVTIEADNERSIRHRLDAILTGCGKPWGGSHRCNFGYLAFSVYVWLRPHDNAAGPSPSNARSLAPQRYCVATMMPPQMAASPPPR